MNDSIPNIMITFDSKRVVNIGGIKLYNCTKQYRDEFPFLGEHQDFIEARKMLNNRNIDYDKILTMTHDEYIEYLKSKDII